MRIHYALGLQLVCVYERLPPSRQRSLDGYEDRIRTNGPYGKLRDMNLKWPKSTDLLENYDHGYSADGRSDVNGRPWHFRKDVEACGMKVL